MKYRKQISLILIYLCLVGLSGYGHGAGLYLKQKSVLDPENENEARLNRLQPPEEVLKAVGITKGMTVAEIGAGRGRYVVQLAVRVGEIGKVYAEDIDAAALSHLKNRCEQWGLENVEIILGEVIDPKLPEGKLDLIFVISSYHHFDDPVSLLRTALSALKPEGKLAVVEWIPWNKNDHEGTTPEKMKAEMNDAGYILERTESINVAKKLNIYIFKMKDSYPFYLYFPEADLMNSVRSFFSLAREGLRMYIMCPAL
jgi:ubiquinone/menaquinone biosynthesis C-methylase UbiE